MPSDPVNSQSYWNRRFTENWGKASGPQQTQFFAELFAEEAPTWFRRLVSAEARSLCDAGCAQGQALDFLRRHFGIPTARGLDFSHIAVEQASINYRECHFEVADLITDELEKADLVFCSNVLEHFPTTEQQMVLRKLINAARIAMVCLVPFREFERDREHLSTFDYDSLPLSANGAYLAFARIVDTAHLPGSQWRGKQLLSIYVNDDVVIPATDSAGSSLNGYLADQQLHFARILKPRSISDSDPASLTSADILGLQNLPRLRALSLGSATLGTTETIRPSSQQVVPRRSSNPTQGLNRNSEIAIPRPIATRVEPELRQLLDRNERLQKRYAQMLAAAHRTVTLAAAEQRKSVRKAESKIDAIRLQATARIGEAEAALEQAHQERRSATREATETNRLLTRLQAKGARNDRDRDANQEELQAQIVSLRSSLEQAEDSRAELAQQLRRKDLKLRVGSMLHQSLALLQDLTPELLRKAVRPFYLPVYKALFPDGNAPYETPLTPSVENGETPESKPKPESPRVRQPVPQTALVDRLFAGRPPKVSVVLPIWNHADLLADSIQSVLTQTHANLELILVDDGSDEDLRPILRPFTSDPRFAVVRVAHQGLPQALNTGFRRATGDFWTWTSADNLMQPLMLETLVRFLLEHPDTDMTFGNMDLIDEEGRPLVDSDYRIACQDPEATNRLHLPRAVEPLSIVADNFIGAAFLYRAQAARVVGEYDVHLIGVEDYDYWLRIAATGVIEHVGREEPLYSYRVHPRTLSVTRRDEIIAKVEKLIAHHEERVQVYQRRFKVMVAGTGAEPDLAQTASELAEAFSWQGHQVTFLESDNEEPMRQWTQSLGSEDKAIAIFFSAESLHKFHSSSTAANHSAMCVIWSTSGILPAIPENSLQSTWVLTNNQEAIAHLPPELSQRWSQLFPTHFSTRKELSTCLKARTAAYPLWDVPEFSGSLWLYLGPMADTDVDWTALALLVEGCTAGTLLLISTIQKDSSNPLKHFSTPDRVKYLGWKPASHWYPYLSRATILLAPLSNDVNPNNPWHDTIHAYLAAAKPILATPAIEKIGHSRVPNLLIRMPHEFAGAAVALEHLRADKLTADRYRSSISPQAVVKQLTGAANTSCSEEQLASTSQLGTKQAVTPRNDQAPTRCLIETSTLHRGGLERVVADLAASFTRNHIEVSVVVTEKAGDIAQECREIGIPVYADVSTATVFGDLLKRLAPDLLVSHFSTLGAPLAWQAGIPVVSYWHNCFVWMSEKREEDFRRNDLYVSHYVAVSQAVSRNFSERFGISPSKITAIPNGVSIERLQQKADTSAPRLHRASLGLKQEDFVLLNVGSFYGTKAQMHALSALRSALADCPKLRLLFLGDKGDPTYYKLVTDKIDAWGLTDHVRICEPTDRIHDYYRMADGLLLASITEGWSLAKTEAMYFGLPMILTRVGGAEEVIDNDDIGILIEPPCRDLAHLTPARAWELALDETPPNLDQIVAAIKDLYTRLDRWKVKGRAGRTKVQTTYQLDLLIQRHLDLIRSVVHQHFGSKHVASSFRSRAKSP